MHYPIELTAELTQQITQSLALTEADKVLDVTAFGDVFIQRSHADQTQHLLYSFTDGTISDVTALIAEHGLPPVSLDLGDEWYQLSAQAMLHGDGLALAPNECFGFMQPVYDGGEYGPHNIQIVKMADYHQRYLAGLKQA